MPLPKSLIYVLIRDRFFVRMGKYQEGVASILHIKIQLPDRNGKGTVIKLGMKIHEVLENIFFT